MKKPIAKQIDRFAEVRNLVPRGRSAKETFFIDYGIRVVGVGIHMEFELWTREDQGEPRLVGAFAYYGAAQIAAEVDFGRSIDGDQWRETDPAAWRFTD